MSQSTVLEKGVLIRRAVFILVLILLLKPAGIMGKGIVEKV